MIDFSKKVLEPCLRTFGQEVEYRPRTGDPFTVRGIFNAAHVMVDVESEVGVSTTRPTLGIRLADFASPPDQEDQVLIDGKPYVVTDVQVDGPGVGALLILHKP